MCLCFVWVYAYGEVRCYMFEPNYYKTETLVRGEGVFLPFLALG